MPASFHDRIRKTLRIDPAAQAIEYKGRWYSWGELAAVVEGVDAALDRAGLPPNGAAGILLRNTPQIGGAALSLIASDRCLMTLNPFYPDLTLAEDIRKLKPAVVIAGSDDWRRGPVRDAVAAF